MFDSRIGHYVSQLEYLSKELRLTDRYEQISLLVPSPNVYSYDSLRSFFETRLTFVPGLMGHLLKRVSMFRFCAVDTYGLSAQVQGNPCRMYSIARDWGVARTGFGAPCADWNQLVRDACGFAPEEKWVYIHCREDQPGFEDDHSQAFRTFDHATMHSTIVWLSGRGYRVVLQGFPQREYDHIDGLDVDRLAGFSFDLQVALLAGASAFLGSTSGLFHLASFFDVPCVLTNIIQADTGPLTARDWGISKRIFDTRLGRHLSVEETLNLEWLASFQDGVGSGCYEIVDNSGEEILSLCKEAFEVLGSYGCNQGSIATVYYQSLFTPRHAAFPYNANVGTDFMLANSDNFLFTEKG